MNLRELMTLENVGWKVTVPKEEIINGIEAIFFDDISYDLYDWHTVKTFSKYFKVENIGGWRLPTIEELKYIINDLTIEYIKDNIFGIWQICLWSADEDSETDRWAWAIHIAGEVRDNAVDVWKVFKKNPHSAILVLKSK